MAMQQKDGALVCLSGLLSLYRQTRLEYKDWSPEAHTLQGCRTYRMNIYTYTDIEINVKRIY